MSSDDGIYILQTQWPATAQQQFKRLEFRVAYGICIDNLWYVPPWDSRCPQTKGCQNGTYIRDGSYANLAVMWRMFHGAPIDWSLSQARSRAKRMLKGYEDQGAPCEYGITELTYDGVFPTPFAVASFVGQHVRQTLQGVATRDNDPVLKKDLKNFYLALSDFTAILPYLFSNEFQVSSSED